MYIQPEITCVGFTDPLVDMDLGQWSMPLSSRNILQKEPRVHSTSVGLTIVCHSTPHSSQGSAGSATEVCGALQGSPSLTRHQTVHAQWFYRQSNSHHCLSRRFHVIRVNLLSSLKQWQTCHFWTSGKHQSSLRCWAGSTGPTRGCQALMPPSECVSNSLVRSMHAGSLLEVTLWGVADCAAGAASCSQQSQNKRTISQTGRAESISLWPPHVKAVAF